MKKALFPAHKEKVIHSLLFASTIILYFIVTMGIMIYTAVMSTSSAVAYILVILESLGFGYLIYYIMEESKPDHITEAGLLIPLPIVVAITVIVQIVNAVTAAFEKMALAPGLAGQDVGVTSLFNPNMPSFIWISIVAYAAFNAPLGYLLIKRKEFNEMRWCLLAPVLLAAVLFITYALINMMLGGLA